MTLVWRDDCDAAPEGDVVLVFGTIELGIGAYAAAVRQVDGWWIVPPGLKGKIAPSRWAKFLPGGDE